MSISEISTSTAHLVNSLLQPQYILRFNTKNWQSLSHKCHILLTFPGDNDLLSTDKASYSRSQGVNFKKGTVTELGNQCISRYLERRQIHRAKMCNKLSYMKL